MHFSPQALMLLRDRYLLPGEEPHQLFARVAGALRSDALRRDFTYVMEELLFLPNSPTLMNAGTKSGQLSACFVLPIRDSIGNIFQTLGHMALIHQSGGGTGFSFSHIRPRGDVVDGASGVASGPLSFIRVFDAATAAVRQGGKRRGANMGVLASSHPDIMEFINCKRNAGLDNFNLSVGYDAEFFRCLSSGKPYALINPRDGQVQDEIAAASLWNAVADAAWTCGDPGILFLDEINRKNTLPGYDSFEATNPCGEQPLFSYESCNLGSVNLTGCVRKGDIDMDLLRYIVRTGISFLDSVIDVNRFPLPEIREHTLDTRKIGLGIMGLADMFIALDIPYESAEALLLAERIMTFIQEESRAMSAELGEWKGSFPAIDRSIFTGDMRNATVTTIAPTGSLHLIAGTSSGIEPLFSLAYEREIGEQTIAFMHPAVEAAIGPDRASLPTDLLGEVRRTGSLQHINLPEHTKDLLKTAPEIEPAHHVRMQAAIQRHTDNAVSKTINLPETATVDDIKEIFGLARELMCKGITVYRYNSKDSQALRQGCDVCKINR
ncbi:MAG: adenosylcobalamin-dependent ribonucleoside-diphosphate reductase [Methanomicrobiaceae archaeon]|nr:adenosylcobalamin-dependent ribonucleoside-diphosphate reductase [Methanomicrobiaceae archaeon]